MMNTNIKCLLSAVVGAGLGYYAARTILVRNYTISVSDAFFDARGHSGPGYKKQVTVMVNGQIERQATYPTDAPETDAPSAVADEPKKYEGVEMVDVASLYPSPITHPAANRAMLNYQGLDLNPEAQEQHVREEFLGDLERKVQPDYEPDPEEEEDHGYGQSPLSGGSDAPVFREPFRISEQAYQDGVPGFDSLMVIYYMGDGVLVDHLGQPLGKVAAMEAIGDPRALRFGEESHDPDICYMRCDQLRTDFEVMRSEGNFSDVPPSGGNG